ncbi:hypothetical protein [Lysinibacillus piscis]|uniref:Uncharacterized protein n=1 Tax=Lysinibacillus piscis TaxID=2518931 RepID=A0ABQ5NLY4_9BACI|nr:hypothetical protein [Lysinibacillus sp. KH24]GLC89318.1 hypothetical protein LYSBPC_24450 [Lysinibacillus sp. KH24]
MKNKLVALIEVRKLVTLAFALLFIYLAVRAMVSADYIESIITMVIGYYFGRSTALDKGGK